MSGTSNRLFKLGDKYWCVMRKLPHPMLGTIIRLTNTAGKHIGLQFEEDVCGHSCDGHGLNGRCFWVTTEWIYSEEEWESLSKISRSSQMFAHEALQESLDELVIKTNQNPNSLPS